MGAERRARARVGQSVLEGEVAHLVWGREGNRGELERCSYEQR